MENKKNLSSHIPIFPIFKPISLEDKEILDEYASQFPPYSDFNFVSLWCFNTKGKIAISNLHGNLAVQFEDYLTSKLFYSFLGSNEVEKTAHTLLSSSRSNPQLKLIPEEAIQNLKEGFLVQEDPNNFDYIISLEDYINLSGHSYRRQRNFLNKAEHRFPECHFLVLKKDDFLKQNILNIFTLWAEEKVRPQQIEFVAIERLLDHLDKLSVDIFGIKCHNDLVGFLVAEPYHDKTIIGHFVKLTPSHKDLHTKLVYEVFRLYFSQGFRFCNMGQDLGIQEIRFSKQHFNPVAYLKKYTISFS